MSDSVSLPVSSVTPFSLISLLSAVSCLGSGVGVLTLGAMFRLWGSFFIQARQTGYNEVLSWNCARSTLLSKSFMTKVWWKAVFNGIGFLRRRRTPRGDFVGEGKGLSKLWSRFNGDDGKSSPANLSTIRSAVLKAPDNRFLAVPISAGKMSNCHLICDFFKQLSYVCCPALVNSPLQMCPFWFTKLLKFEKMKLF